MKNRSIAFIGAGRVAQTLSSALLDAGWPVDTIASRNFQSAERLAAQHPGCRAASMEEASQCDWVLLTVPDDSIQSLADKLPWRSNQYVIHCSGATEVSVLGEAERQGALTGSFHPLQIFSNPSTAVKNLRGSSVAIDGAPSLLPELTSMAHALGMHPIQLPAGTRPLYHAAAGYAASMIIALLHEAVQLWSHLGIDETQALHALLPLAKGTLSAVEKRGLAGALAGPASRGDVAVLREHLRVMDGLGSSHGAIYRSMLEAQIHLARSSGRLSEEKIQALSQLLRIIRSAT